LTALAREQRMAPMLDYRDEQAGRQWPIPDDVRAAWRAGATRAAMRALEFERALRNSAAVMAAADVPFIALKGSWLAWHAYPKPGLRPMRDIDLWVPADRALAAQAALIAAGGTEISHGYDAAETLVHDAKTLPPVRSPYGGIIIELHLHLSHHHGPDDGDGKGDDHAPPEDLLPDRMVTPWGGHPMGYLSPTDTLLHLIVHSAYDHGFNNGPGVFDDIAFTLNRHAIDWPRFWTRAAQQGWTKGCVLLLALTERQQGPLPIEWMGHAAAPLPDAVVEAVLPLTLQSAEQRATIAFLGQVPRDDRATWRWRRWIGRLFARLTVPQARLAMYLGVASDSPLAWAAYPLWLADGTWRIVRGWSDGDIRRAARQRALISAWIDSSAQARRR